MKYKRKPPQWHRFDRWVVLGALAGLGIASMAFVLIHHFLFGGIDLSQFKDSQNINPSDIISATATALGGLTIGGVAIMQYRKHKWAEYQGKLDEDSRTGERLSQAIEHLGSKELHVRLGAIYEFKNLAEDSPRNKENIVQILTAFVKAYQDSMSKEKYFPLPQDVEAAAETLSQLTRELIEETSETARRKNRWRPFKLAHFRGVTWIKTLKTKMKVQNLLRPLKKQQIKPPLCIFKATEVLSKFALNRWSRNVFLKWPNLKASWVDLSESVLKGVFLRSARLEGVDLGLARLEGADLREAYLGGAQLNAARLEGANLGSARLEGAIFFLAHLENTDLRKAHFDEKTTFGKDLFIAPIDNPEKADYGKSVLMAHTNDKTRFDPGVRMKYFGEEEPDRPLAYR